VKFHTSLFALALLTISGNALAQNCSVNVTPMAFGLMEPSDGIPIDSVGDISVTCDEPTSFLVRLEQGQNSGSFFPRMMRLIGGAATLEYNLFLDASMILIWGDGSGGSSAFNGFSAGVGQSIPVYGRIYGGQSPPPGSYGDSVTVIVEW